MKGFTIIILSVFAVALTVTLAAEDKARELKLQQAIDLIESKGDLAKAMPLLEDVATSSDRALAARGLLQLAQAQERFGQGDAFATYQRIVNDFGAHTKTLATSTVVSAARARLATMEQKGAGLVARQVWNQIGDTVSPDGRYITFTDWNTGDLAAHDLTSGRDRSLTNNGKWNGSFAEFAAPSPDSRLIAYSWHTSGRPRDLRVIGRDGGQPRVVYPNTEKAVFVTPWGWLPDGKWILATIHKGVVLASTANATQSFSGPYDLVLIPVSGGAVRHIRHFDVEGGFLRATSRFSVSPDGRSVVYTRPVTLGKPERDVFSLSLDSGLEVSMLSHAADEYVLGWFPDGNRILFASDRGGTYGIWATRVVAGRADGEPILIRPGTSRVQAQGFSRKGDFYYSTSNAQSEVYLATLDPATGKQTSALARLEGRYTGLKSQAAWSPDGDRIVYVQEPTIPATGAVRNQTLAIQTTSTGEVRQHALALQNMQSPAWLPDGRAVIVQGRDLDGRQGMHLVNIDTGGVTAIGVRDPANDIRREQPASSPDGRRVFFKWSSVTTPPEGGIGARDLSSGAEQKVTTQSVWSFSPSPDGRWFAAIPSGRGPNYGLLVIPSSGGGSETLSAVSSWTISRDVVAWSVDNRFIFVVKQGDRRQEIWQVPLDGTEPRNTGTSWSGTISRISVHPDGRRLALSTQGTLFETWVLQNLPAQREK